MMLCEPGGKNRRIEINVVILCRYVSKQFSRQVLPKIRRNPNQATRESLQAEGNLKAIGKRSN